MEQRIVRIILVVAFSLLFSVGLKAQGLTKIVSVSEDGVKSDPIYVLNTQTEVNLAQNEYIPHIKKNRYVSTQRRHDWMVDLRVVSTGDVVCESYGNISSIPAISMTYKGIYLMYARYNGDYGDSVNHYDTYMHEDELSMGYLKTVYFGKHLFFEGMLGVGISTITYGYLDTNDIIHKSTSNTGLSFHASPRIGYELSPIAIFAEFRYRSTDFNFEYHDHTSVFALGISLRL